MTTATFEINGTAYTTDADTLNVLRPVVASAKATGDSSAVIAMLALGEKTGRIRKTLTAYAVTFKIGRRVMTWTRFAETLEKATSMAKEAVSDAYGPKASILSVVAV